jgi:integrase
MSIHKLTETRIKKLIQQGEKGKHGDGGNLWLEVAGVDVAIWFLRWKDRVTKKDSYLSYGPWHINTLDDVREKARVDRQLIWQGKNPKAERDQRILEEQIAQGKIRSVRQVIAGYDKDVISTSAENTQISARRSLAYINRCIGDMLITKVDKHIVLNNVLKKDDLWNKKNETAKKVQTQLIGMFKYAISEGLVDTGYNPALWEHLSSALAKPGRVHKVKHHPGVPYKRMPEFMAHLRAFRHNGKTGPMAYYKGRPPLALCLELIALTACRPGEARLAQWKQFDFENMIWNVPPENLKEGDHHGEIKRVPISKSMMAMLEQAKQIAYPKISSKRDKKGAAVNVKARHEPDTSPEAWLFPNRQNEAFDDSDISRFMRGYLSKQWRPACPHGFRTTLKDWCRAKKKSMEWWKIQVDHRGGKLDQAYGRDDLLDERRGMMEEYDRDCSPQPPPKPKVVKISDERKRRTA